MSRPRAASLAAVFAVVFIDLLGFGIVLPLLARYGKYHQADGLTLGALMASFSAMQFLFAPFWGRLSDRVGRRPVLLVGLAGSVVSYALFGWADGLAPDARPLGLSPLGWLFVSRIGAGVAGATITTAQAYIADVTSRENRAKGMALIGAAFGLGFTFGPLIGAPFVSGTLADRPSSAPGYLAAGLSAAALAFAWFFLREPERHAGSAVKPRGRVDLLADPLRAAMVAEIHLTTAAFALFESTLTLLTARLGYADRGNYLVFAFVGFVLTLAQGLLVRRLAPRLRERRMAPLGLALMTAGLLALVFVRPGEAAASGVLFAGLVVTVVGFAFLTSSLSALLSLTAPATEQGAVLGLGQSAGALARITGPVLGLWLFDRSPTATYALAAAAMAVGLVTIVPVLAAVRRSGRDDVSEAAVDPAEAIPPPVDAAGRIG